TDFNSQHGMALLAQPEQVTTLATQGNEHGTAGRRPGLRPEILQVKIDLLLVKSDLAIAPPGMPEIRIHDYFSLQAAPLSVGRNQSSLSCRRTTSPTMIRVGGLRSLLCTSSGRLSRVLMITRWCWVVPCCTRATGVSAG